MLLRHAGGEWLAWGIVRLLVLFALSGIAQAIEVIPDFYKDPGISPNRAYVNQSFKEHIDPFNGSLQLHYVDIHLPGDGGFDLSVVRSYNSASFAEANPAAFDSQAGLGWSIHFGRVMHRTNTLPCSGSAFGMDTLGNPVIELPDGSTQLLLYSGAVSPLMYTTQRWKADCAPGGLGLIVYSPDGTRYDMTQQVTVGSGTNIRTAWYTKTIVDRNGNTATIFYAASASPRISSVSTSDGRSLTFDYRDGMVSSIATLDYTYFYEYEAVPGVFGRYFLRTVRRPEGTTWQYRYNGALNNVPGSYALTGVTYPENGTITYGYGNTDQDWVYFDRTTIQAHRSTVVKTKVTSDGGNWSFAYEPGAPGQFDKTTVAGPAGATTYRHVGPNYALSGDDLWRVGLLVERQIGNVQTETYSWLPQQVSGQRFKRPGAWSTRFDSVTYAAMLSEKTIVRDGQTYRTQLQGHDQYGNPTTVSENGPYAGSRTTTLTYFSGAAKWIIKQVKNQSITGGVAIAREFDGNGNLSLFTRDQVSTGYVPDARGNVSETTFPRTLVHRYSDYRFGIARTEVQPEGISLFRQVSNVGNLQSENNGEGKTTTYQYDGLNRLKRIAYHRGNPVDITYTATRKTATRGALQEITDYDGFGRPISVSIGGVPRTYRYDPLGRLTFASNPSSTAGTSYTYDILDRPRLTTHPDQNSREVTYLPGGKRVRNERNHNTTYWFRSYGDPDETYTMKIDAPLASANIEMERNGKNLVTQVRQGGLTRSYDYNPKGYLTQVINPETGVTTYGRDDAGNMTTRKVGASGTTTYVPDGQNRLWQVIHPGATPAVTKTYSRTHRLKSVESSTAIRRFDYDDNDNLINEQLTVDGLTFALAYGYNSNDQIVSHTYPVSNRLVDYAPDVLGRPKRAGAFVSNVTYHPSGQVDQIAYANGVTTTYGQNIRLWPSSFMTARSQTYASSSYGYDPAGNLQTITDSVDPSYNRGLDHDALNRLTVANGPWGGGTIGYDAVGNITHQTLGTHAIGYTYSGATNRLQSVNGSRSATFGYDDYGNIVSTGSRTHGYDTVPNLVCANCNDPASRADYQYDGLNQRVWSQRGGVRTYEFFSADGQLRMELTPSQSNRLVEHIYLGNKRVAQIAPTQSSVSTGGGALVATAGKAVSLSITVAGSSPSGTVSLYEGATLLGTAPVVNGAAQLTVTFGTPGKRTVTVVYSGDASNSPSTTTIEVEVLIAPEVLIPILDLLLGD